MSAAYGFRASGVGSIHPEKVPGSFLDALIEMTADNSYPAGGYAFGPTQLQALSGGAYSSIESVDIANPVFVSSTGVPQAFLAVWDKVNQKVRILSLATDAELGAGNAGANGLICTLRVRFN